MTLAVSIAQSGANNVTMRNRIINGAMMIDQRNAGASVTPASGADTFVVDRFSIYSTQASKTTAQQNQGSVTPPAGFKNYLGVTSSSAYSVLATDLFGLFQNIEGLNVADLGWGTSNAQPVTLSFWARSSLTGTFGGGILNQDQNRSYPFSYTISSANTWEYKTITIPGDQSGTWLTTNGRGITVCWSLGMGSNRSGTANTWAAAGNFAPTGATNLVGTSGATLYITGVQLEEGTTATAFEQRLYGTELALCQRYYEKSFAIETAPQNGLGPVTNGTIYGLGGVAYATNAIRTPQYKFSVTKRTAPSITLWSPSPSQGGAADGNWTSYISGGWVNSTSTQVVDSVTHQYGFAVELSRAGSFVVGYSYLTGGNWTASAEL